jgi:hypothetical protein
MTVTRAAKPSIVFCHGIWADGSCFSKVIPSPQAEGYEVMAAQYGLDTNEGDVAAARAVRGSTAAVVKTETEARGVTVPA